MKHLLQSIVGSEERQAYRCHNGETLLHIAASKDSLSAIRELIYINNLDPNSLNDNCETPLVYACRYNNYAACRVLLSLGANPNLLTRGSDSALLWASYRNNVDNIKILSSYGADPTHTYIDGKGIFLWAVRRGSKEALSYILENISVEMNERDISGSNWNDLTDYQDVADIVIAHRRQIMLYFFKWLSDRDDYMLDRNNISDILNFF
jgi:ankyrin repeat protein